MEVFIMTPRELDILKFIVQGLSNKEIAQELYISEHTVKAHLESIFDKIGCKNRVQAAVYAVNNCFIK